MQILEVMYWIGTAGGIITVLLAIIFEIRDLFLLND